MKRKSPPTEQSATKDTSAKRGRPSGTATEHATSGTATEHAALGPDIKDFRGPGKDLRFEIMFREACSKAPPNVERLLQEVKALGHYPQRYKHAATKGERDSNSLAKKLAKAKGHFTSEVQKYLEAMQANSERAAATRTATEHAQNAQSLMQQVRKLGHLPRESESHPQEQLLAQQLRKAKANGFLVAHEEELEDFADKPVAIQKEAAATRTATEHAQHAQSLMQQVRKLGHLPRESQSKPHEQVLARQLRDAKASGFLVAYEEELRHIAAADAKAVTMRLATERAREVTTLHQQIWACTDGRGDLSNPSAVARQVRKMSTDRRVLQSPVM
jgi:acetolactate synthase regulatory subunit